ncbi:MAG TPA: Lrp/AsnC family transcriptional regulator [Symbiobacteriaceae bacterium]|jgi:Lrp/AsnC family leucine-responsive transcriptional regulator|nr:Lrp/AsnC family transcriptional regulator [Symbiobacteriaceae bacterium]
MGLDEIDLLILGCLTANARLSWAEIAATAGITRQTVAERVERLKEANVIKAFVALIDPEAVGADLTAFVSVSIERPEQCEGFLAAIATMPHVQECHHVAGDDNYLLKVRTRGTRGLERLITGELKRIPGVVRTRTTIVLSTAKETPVPPVEAAR